MKKIAICILLFTFSFHSSAFFPFFTPVFHQKSTNYSDLSKLIKDYQPDYEREERIVNQIADSVIEGEVEWLEVSQRKFFSIYTESDSDRIKGGVIILHSRGFHPNWEDVVKPLRVNLAQKGWNTLSVQMPVLNKKAKYYDYVPILPYAGPRIQAAIDFYKQKGINRIILVAHACGAHMARHFLDKYGEQDLSGFVGIGMGATDFGQRALNPIIFTLMQLNIPILDVLAEHDYPAVQRFARARNEAFIWLKKPKNKQAIIKDASHYYTSPKATVALVHVVASWLDDIQKNSTSK